MRIMIHFVSTQISMLLNRNGFFDSKNIEVYTYGVEIIISSLIGVSIIILIGICFFSLLDAVLFLAPFIVIRSFCGGYHASTYLKCEICSSAVFVFVSILSKNLFFPKEQLLIILLLCLIVLGCISPVENEHKPIKKEDKFKMRFVSVFLFFFFIICTMIIGVWVKHAFYQLAYTLISITVLALIGHGIINTRKEKI